MESTREVMTVQDQIVSRRNELVKRLQVTMPGHSYLMSIAFPFSLLFWSSKRFFPYQLVRIATASKQRLKNARAAARDDRQRIRILTNESNARLRLLRTLTRQLVVSKQKLQAAFRFLRSTREALARVTADNFRLRNQLREMSEIQETVSFLDQSGELESDLLP